MYAVIYIRLKKKVVAIDILIATKTILIFLLTDHDNFIFFVERKQRHLNDSFTFTANCFQCKQIYIKNCPLN